MPDYKIHLFAGIIAVASTVFYLTYGFNLWQYFEPTITYLTSLFVIATIGSLLPDIDATGSKVFATLIGAFIIIAITGITLKNWTITGVAVIAMLVSYAFSLAEHRGITHTIWFSLGISFLVHIFSSQNYILSAATFAAIYSHQLLDGYPLKIKIKPTDSLW